MPKRQKQKHSEMPLIFEKAKKLFARDFSNKDVAEFCQIGESTASKIKSCATFAEYKQMRKNDAEKARLKKKEKEDISLNLSDMNIKKDKTFGKKTVGDTVKKLEEALDEAEQLKQEKSLQVIVLAESMNKVAEKLDKTVYLMNEILVELKKRKGFNFFGR